MSFPRFHTIAKMGLLVFIALFLSTCQTHKKKTDEFSKYEGKDPHEIFQLGERDMQNEHFNDALSHFNAIDTLYPYTEDAEQAKVYLIYVQYKREDLPATVSAAKSYLRLYPGGKNADYAYYMKGLANAEMGHGIFTRYLPLNIAERDLTNERAAFEDFNELLTQFPTSSYAKDARQRMVYLRNLLAGQELAVAEYYLWRKAYVASANRATFIIEHFQTSTQTRPALKIMIKAYHQLGMKDLEEKSLALLKANEGK